MSLSQGYCDKDRGYTCEEYDKGKCGLLYSSPGQANWCEVRDPSSWPAVMQVGCVGVCCGDGDGDGRVGVEGPELWAGVGLGVGAGIRGGARAPAEAGMGCSFVGNARGVRNVPRGHVADVAQPIRGRSKCPPVFFISAHHDCTPALPPPSNAPTPSRPPPTRPQTPRPWRRALPARPGVTILTASPNAPPSYDVSNLTPYIVPTPYIDNTTLLALLPQLVEEDGSVNGYLLSKYGFAFGSASDTGANQYIEASFSGEALLDFLVPNIRPDLNCAALGWNNSKLPVVQLHGTSAGMAAPSDAA